MPTATRVIKNTGFLYLKMGISMFISLWTTRLILNSLGASDFGIYNVVGGAIAMLGFLNATMASSTQRFMSYAEGERNREKQKTIFTVSVVLHITIAFLACILLIICGFFFFNGILNIPESRMTAAVIVYGSLIISTMFIIITVPYDAIINAHEDMKYYALVGILEAVLKLAVAFICVYISYDKLITYGILMAFIPFVTMIILWRYCHAKYEECIFSIQRYYDRHMMKQMTSFAGWKLLSISSSMISQYGLGIVLNHFYGTLLNAAHGIANQLSGQLMSFSNNMLKAVNPVITKNEGAGEHDAMILISLYSSKYSYLLLAAFAIPFIVDMDYILKLWLKNVPIWAVVFCQLQLIRSLLEQLTISLGTAISSTGRIAKYSRLKSVANLLPLIITYLLFASNFPPYAMYVAWIVFGSVIGGVILLYFAHCLCTMQLNDYIKIVLVPCGAITIVIIFCAFLIRNFVSPSLIRFLSVFAITLLVVIFLSYSLGTPKERDLIKSLILKIKGKTHN